MNISEQIISLKELGVSRSAAIQAIKKSHEDIDEIMEAINETYGEISRTTADWPSRVALVMECVEEGMTRKDTIAKMIDSGIWGGKATATQFAASIPFCIEWANQS